MRRANPKLLVLIAAVLTVALLAFVFAGGGSRADRPPKDRLTDEQAGMIAPTRAPQLPDASDIIAGGEGDMAQTEEVPPPPAPEPEVEPAPVSRPAPIARPAPPEPPRRNAKPEVRETTASRPKARVEELPRAQVAKPRPKAVASARRPAASAEPAAKPPAPTRLATVRPSYNCRYARTRSEVAVCGDAGLARLDQQMAAQFSTAYRQATAAQRQVLERSRMRFLYRRDRCQSASCIAQVYRTRMSEINDIAARNWRE